MEKHKFIYFSLFLIATWATCATTGCVVAGAPQYSDACAAAMQDIVENGYTSPGFNGPPGDNDCTRWGRYWITCGGPLQGPCVCTQTNNPGVGTCGAFANIIISTCGSDCGATVRAGNIGPGGNPGIQDWGGIMADPGTGVGIF